MVLVKDKNYHDTDMTAGLPITAQTDISIPKETFYQVTGANTTIKRLFVDEVSKLTLKAVIAPRTLNISADTYDELDIIEIQLKDRELSAKVLATIDAVIPRPVLFAIIRPSGEAKYAMSYKELDTTKSLKSKIVHYYQSPWGAEPLRLIGNSVKAIYVHFIQQIEPSFDPFKPITEAVQDTKQREKTKKQIEAINKKIANEPSIAKKQELARQRHELELQRRELVELL